MQVINANSVSQGLSRGLHAIRVHGIKKPSRVGDVLVSPRPIMTVYENPMNRVLFSPMRDANPTFHLMETLWMLAGRNDLPWLVRFNKKFSSYSDDGGKTQPGAYGYRWRNYFGHDQLQDAILELRQNPDSRRVVIAMWDGGARDSWRNTSGDETVQMQSYQPGDSYAAASGSADVPCNTHIYFDTIDGRLNMTVCCRSNDVIWGAYGANAVHFSFLLEYMAAMTGLQMGVYRQFSNNFHLYTNVVAEDSIMPLARDVEHSDLYHEKKGPMDQRWHPVEVRQVPLVRDREAFEADLKAFNERDVHDANEYDEPFFQSVAVPMYNAYMLFKEKDYDGAIDLAGLIRAEDWRKATVEWLTRRQIKHNLNKERFEEVTANG